MAASGHLSARMTFVGVEPAHPLRTVVPLTHTSPFPRTGGAEGTPVRRARATTTEEALQDLERTDAEVPPGYSGPGQRGRALSGPSGLGI